HSIKGMAGSLGYDSITEVAHRMEDRMQGMRTAGRIPPGDELSLLFRALAALETMVGAVAETGDAPAAEGDLLDALATPPAPTAAPVEAESDE
ncbi:MAG: chemotaxis protein CheA, partial [Actinobacteria bacterium]|nr:chemotaxis protein CheA [Actinomycetota bacterium]NIV59039.1 chemotaxis protein CheA [Actinomycetota bacterium]NIX53826.1 chemotaxis protein CheA [Actinomycetota bacterium]